MNGRPALALFALLIAACGGPAWEEIRAAGEAAVEARRAEVEGHLGRLTQIARTIDVEIARTPLPPIDWGDRPAPDFGGRIGGPNRKGNAALLSYEQLVGKAVDPKTSSERAETKGLTWFADWLEVPRRMLDGWIIDVVSGEDTVEQARANVDRAVERLLEVRYVLVARTHELVVGEVENLTGAAFDPKLEGSAGSFASGRFVGDVLLFDVTNGAFLGGAAVEARNSEKVEIRGYAGFLKEDLAANVRKAIAAAWNEATGK